MLLLIGLLFLVIGLVFVWMIVGKAKEMEYYRENNRRILDLRRKQYEEGGLSLRGRESIAGLLELQENEYVIEFEKKVLMGLTPAKIFNADQSEGMCDGQELFISINPDQILATIRTEQEGTLVLTTKRFVFVSASGVPVIIPLDSLMAMEASERVINLYQKGQNFGHHFEVKLGGMEILAHLAYWSLKEKWAVDLEWDAIRYKEYPHMLQFLRGSLNKKINSKQVTEQAESRSLHYQIDFETAVAFNLAQIIAADGVVEREEVFSMANLLSSLELITDEQRQQIVARYMDIVDDIMEGRPIHDQTAIMSYMKNAPREMRETLVSICQSLSMADGDCSEEERAYIKHLRDELLEATTAP